MFIEQLFATFAWQVAFGLYYRSKDTKIVILVSTLSEKLEVTTEYEIVEKQFKMANGEEQDP